MADSPLIDIFDLCVERLAAGETVEDCLRDYPGYADELRGLLEMGSLVFQAQAHTNNEEQAQAHTRMRIEEALQTDFAADKGRNSMIPDSEPRKEKNTAFTLRRSVFWFGSAAAAVFAFAFGFAFTTTPGQPQGLTIADYSNPTIIPSEAVIVAELPTLAPVLIEASSTQVAAATMTTTPMPTVTQILALPTEAAFVMNTPTMAPADVSGAAHGDAIVGGVVTGEKDVSSTSSGAPIPLAPAVVNGAAVDADKTDGYTSDGRTVSESGALAVIGGGGGGGGPTTDLLSLPTPALSYGDESTGLAAPVNVQQQGLQPLKAGEIDDNAEWDTYTEFRRNYLSTYGSSSIIDFDITGRRIIKVVDGEGKPILGARVEVYMDQTLVSKSLTYATGLTLFFPNADAKTQRRDEFKIVVTVGQYQAFQTLDLRKLGDVVEIQMPIVIVRDANSQQNGLPTVPPPPEMPTVVIGIPDSLPTVPPPMVEATMIIETNHLSTPAMPTFTPTPMLPTFTPTPFVR